LKSLEELNLCNTSLSAIDLSIFNGMDHVFDLYLDDNAFLKSLTISDADKFPKSASVSLYNTGLETIDSKLGNLWGKSTENFGLGRNVHLKCENLNWMAKYVKCDYGLSIDGSRCADKGGQLLSEYLRGIEPKPNCTTINSSNFMQHPKMIRKQ